MTTYLNYMHFIHKTPTASPSHLGWWGGRAGYTAWDWLVSECCKIKCTFNFYHFYHCKS